MNVAWILFSAILSLLAIGWLVTDFFFGEDHRIQQRIRRAQQASGQQDAGKSSLFRDWKLSSEETANLVGRCRQYVEQSGLPFSLEHLAIASSVAGGVGALFGGLLTRESFGAVAGGLIGLAVFPWIVSSTRKRRIETFTRQLPDVFDVMSRAVSSGQTVASALHLVGSECRPPISREFALCCEQQNLGLPQDTTLRDLARRVPVPELHIFVIALLVQRQCGGSPVEVLSSISDMIRKRLRLSNRVQALTGEGRMQAIVLTILPIAAFTWLWVVQRDYVEVLLVRPWLIATVIGLQLVGTVWIRRTIRIDY